MVLAITMQIVRPLVTKLGTRGAMQNLNKTFSRKTITDFFTKPKNLKELGKANDKFLKSQGKIKETVKISKKPRTTKKTATKKSPTKKTKTTATTKTGTKSKLPPFLIGATTIGGGAMLTSGNKARPPKTPNNNNMTFNQAFAKARKEKGKASSFMFKGKSYSTATMEDVNKAGFDNLKDYLNSLRKK